MAAGTPPQRGGTPGPPAPQQGRDGDGCFLSGGMPRFALWRRGLRAKEMRSQIAAPQA